MQKRAHWCWQDRNTHNPEVVHISIVVYTPCQERPIWGNWEQLEIHHSHVLGVEASLYHKHTQTHRYTTYTHSLHHIVVSGTIFQWDSSWSYLRTYAAISIYLSKGKSAFACAQINVAHTNTCRLTPRRAKHFRTEQKQNMLMSFLNYKWMHLTLFGLCPLACQCAITHSSYGFSVSIRLLLSSHKTYSGTTQLLSQ